MSMYQDNGHSNNDFMSGGRPLHPPGKSQKLSPLEVAVLCVGILLIFVIIGLMFYCNLSRNYLRRTMSNKSSTPTDNDNLDLEATGEETQVRTTTKLHDPSKVERTVCGLEFCKLGSDGGRAFDQNVAHNDKFVPPKSMGGGGSAASADHEHLNMTSYYYDPINASDMVPFNNPYRRPGPEDSVTPIPTGPSELAVTAPPSAWLMRESPQEHRSNTSPLKSVKRPAGDVENRSAEAVYYLGSGVNFMPLDVHEMATFDKVQTPATKESNIGTHQAVKKRNKSDTGFLNKIVGWKSINKGKMRKESERQLGRALI